MRTTPDRAPSRNPISSDAKTFALVMAVMVALILYRTISYWVTGFYVADESGYYYDAVHGIVYGQRWFFGLFNIFVFRLFGIHDVDSFAMLLPFYLFFWIFFAILALYKTLKVLRFGEKTISLTLISSMFPISFALLSLGFLTDSVGLSLAMVGIFTMVKFACNDGMRTRSFLVYPMVSLLCFIAAAGTREPYSIFVIGWPLAVILGWLGRTGRIIPAKQTGLWTLALAAYLLLTIIAFILLQRFLSDVSQQIKPLLLGLLHDIFPALVSSSGSNAVVLGNAIGIFVGGLVLGWGPTIFVVGSFGLIGLMGRKARARQPGFAVVQLLALLALISYLGVAFVFSSDPTYFSFANYSTILRFSDSALPAFFLAAPFALSRFAKRLDYSVALIGTLLVLTAFTVPAYQTYASSNLSYASTNPFTLDYRTPGAQIRDYFRTNPSIGEVYMIGVPLGWPFTPGVQDLREVHVFTIFPVGLYPPIPYDQFLKNETSNIYVYVQGGEGNFASLPDFARKLVDSTFVPMTLYPFTVTERQVVIQRPDFVLMKIQLEWNRAATS